MGLSAPHIIAKSHHRYVQYFRIAEAKSLTNGNALQRLPRDSASGTDCHASRHGGDGKGPCHSRFYKRSMRSVIRALSLKSKEQWYEAENLGHIPERLQRHSRRLLGRVFTTSFVFLQPRLFMSVWGKIGLNHEDLNLTSGG
ncbi:hypothetical protein CDAR_426861 [Caerostris darwini]|uniref:Uncharacterized protein n=1 Tax=Caerostris darwini TaxID=1538125 RepID=A0AAV4R518_9ARAC|nr:hypothetical protein CDAR_426861 [Caerostris darwini]